ncbi:MAG: hypothetical protein JWL60_750 [Gemmatimonadetes bacterium]|jgi:hypothetical protein|nr:hypothetical protein [Gemmatimonadota bacterium]
MMHRASIAAAQGRNESAESPEKRRVTAPGAESAALVEFGGSDPGRSDRDPSVVAR